MKSKSKESTLQKLRRERDEAETLYFHNSIPSPYLYERMVKTRERYDAELKREQRRLKDLVNQNNLFQ